MRFHGAVDAVALPQAEALLAVLGEALVNVSRRGDVSAVDVAVEVDGDLASRVEGHGPTTPGERPGGGRDAHSGTSTSRFDWRVPRG